MFNSKALKDFSKEKRSKLYLWWIETPVADWYYDYSWKLFGNPWFQFKRLIQWYWNVFRYDYDFDGHCLFGIIEYKLKRIEKVLINGHAYQEDRDMKALKLAIKLAGRLKEDKYSESFYNRHDKKWGELKTSCDRVASRDSKGNPLSYYYDCSRPNADTPEKKKQEGDEHFAFLHAVEAKTKREEKWLYDILFKYLRIWWD